MSRISPYTTLQHYKTNFFSCLPINQDWPNKKFLIEQQQKLITGLNPFSMYPTLTFWFPITRNTRIGLSMQTLERIRIAIRQRLLPNDVMHLTARFIQIKLPFPLMLLVLFFSLGLWINRAVNNIIDNVTAHLTNEQEEFLKYLEEKIKCLFPDVVLDSSQLSKDVMNKVRKTLAEENEKSTQQDTDLFNFLPIMTCYFPVGKTHTGIGIGFIDLQRLSISIRQFMEPLDQIFTSIRFIELKVPFSLSIIALFLCVGLFLNGSINILEADNINVIKNIFQQHQKQNNKVGKIAR